MKYVFLGILIAIIFSCYAGNTQSGARKRTPDSHELYIKRLADISPLLAAVENSDYRGVKQLLETGIDPDVADNAGNTPLIIAAGKIPLEKVDVEIIRLLLKFNATPYLKNNLNETALDKLKENVHYQPHYTLEAERLIKAKMPQKQKLM